MAVRKTCEQLRNEDYERLGVTPEQVGAVRPLSLLVRKLEGRRSQAIGLLRFSEDPAAKAFLKVYDEAPVGSRNRLPIEAFCIAAKVSTRRLLEIIVGEGFERNVMLARAIAFMNAPRNVEKMVEFAKKPGGWKDRMALAMATGFLPTHRGSQTMIALVQAPNRPSALRPHYAKETR